MAEPTDGGFELDGVLFGERGNILVEKFSPGVTSRRSQTAEAPRDDARWFGRDRKTPATWEWSLGINETDEATAHARLDALQAVWDAQEMRETPGAVLPLRYRIAGRTRRIYGRPGRCQEVYDVRRYQGYIGVEADFERADLLHYDETEQSKTISLAAATVGGLKAPLVDPLRSLSTPETSATSSIVVGGSAPTWIVADFAGATGASDLELVTPLWSAGLKGPVTSGETITVDPRPWARTALSSLGGAAELQDDTQLRLMLLPPGTHFLRLAGTDPTGTATVTVRWRDASKTF